MSLKEQLDFKITSLMADLLSSSDDVKMFRQLQNMKESLKEMNID